MKKWYRGNFVKGTLILLEIVLFLAMILSGVYLTFMYVAGVNILESGRGYGYSRRFAEKLYERSREILSVGNWTESSSVYPPGEIENPVVDLEEIAEGKTITWENTSGLAYSYEDLRSWSRNGSFGNEEIVESQDEDGKCIYFFQEDFLKKLKNGEFQVQVNSRWERASGQWESGENDGAEMTEFLWDILNSFDDPEAINASLYSLILDYGEFSVRDAQTQKIYRIIGCYTETDVIDRSYSPAGADNILEAVNASREWNGRLPEAYDALEAAVHMVSSAYYDASALEEYEEGNTNLTYLYVNLDQRTVFSNKSEYSSFGKYSQSLEEMTGSGYYVLVSPVLAECEGNIYMEEFPLQTWQHMVEENCGYGRYLFAVQVDETLPVMDSFYRGEVLYNRYSGDGILVLAVCILSALLFLAVLVWLTIIAGRNALDEEIHLNWFDRWYTELFAGTMFLLWGIAISVIIWISMEIESEEMVFAGAAAAGFCTVILFLIMYLSLVRRIKAGNLWTVSLCRRGLILCVFLAKKGWEFIRKALGFVGRAFGQVRSAFRLAFSSLRTTVKTMLAVGAFLLAQFVLILLANEEVFFLLLLVIVDGVSALYMLRRAWGREWILDGLKRITEGELQYKIPVEQLRGDQKVIAEYINRIGDGLDAAVENSLRSERMKTELITNVSHDIKTPLTSIINYVDLLKRENIQDPKIRGYLDVLDAKAQRLKVLTEDVVEASKASTGSITLNMTELDFAELIHQVSGEFQEKFQERRLTLVMRLDGEAVIIRADGQRMWRVLENIFNNVVKYAMEGTRVYAEINRSGAVMEFSLKNISAQQLNISPDELTERFIRGDISRNTEGSGLGLSIARSLTELQKGTFKVFVDGDLFKVVITFAVAGQPVGESAAGGLAGSTPGQTVGESSATGAGGGLPAIWSGLRKRIRDCKIFLGNRKN